MQIEEDADVNLENITESNISERQGEKMLVDTLNQDQPSHLKGSSILVRPPLQKDQAAAQ